MSEARVYYQSERATLYHGDCLDVLATLDREAVDAVISDPPYGMNWNTDHTRFKVGPNGDGPGRTGSKKHVRIANDAEPFDPAPWLDFPRVVLWGSHHYAARLPVGTTLVWIKRYDPASGSFLSDADLAWMKGGHGVYCHRDLSLQGQSRNRQHPTQKPIGLMAWCMERAKVPDGGLVLDPYAGSGTTAIAALRTGRRCILIECEERYCEAAARRIEAEEAQGDLFRVI